jgi:hypothetical protein
VFLHVPGMSPMQQTVYVPLNERSASTPFVIPEQKLIEGALPPNTLLEVRCRGLLVLMIDLHLAAKHQSHYGGASNST